MGRLARLADRHVDITVRGIAGIGLDGSDRRAVDAGVQYIGVITAIGGGILFIADEKILSAGIDGQGKNIGRPIAGATGNPGAHIVR